MLVLKTSEELCRVLQFLEHLIEQCNMRKVLPQNVGFTDSFCDGYYVLIIIMNILP